VFELDVHSSVIKQACEGHPPDFRAHVVERACRHVESCSKLLLSREKRVLQVHLPRALRRRVLTNSNAGSVKLLLFHFQVLAKFAGAHDQQAAMAKDRMAAAAVAAQGTALEGCIGLLAELSTCGNDFSAHAAVENANPLIEEIGERSALYKSRSGSHEGCNQAAEEALKMGWQSNTSATSETHKPLIEEISGHTCASAQSCPGSHIGSMRATEDDPTSGGHMNACTTHRKFVQGGCLCVEVFAPDACPASLRVTQHDTELVIHGPDGKIITAVDLSHCDEKCVTARWSKKRSTLVISVPVLGAGSNA
jgi:hypothetical protein